MGEVELAAGRARCGGGELVYHSSVFAFHGSGPAIGPFLSAQRRPTTVTATLSAIMYAPN